MILGKGQKYCPGHCDVDVRLETSGIYPEAKHLSDQIQEDVFGLDAPISQECRKSADTRTQILQFLNLVSHNPHKRVITSSVIFL